MIDPEQRAELAARSPYNVVAVDLPEGDDPYARRRRGCSSSWQRRGRRRPRRRARALGARRRTTPGPTAARCTRHGFFARVRVEDYGPGRIRPHERTHPGPKEDRLRLTRATQANLSPDLQPLRRPASSAAWAALEPHTDGRRRGARSPTTTAPSTGSGGSTTPTRSPPCRRRSRRRRAADRRRPPPLRDRARLRRRDRRRGRAPLRADVPRRAAGPGPDGLPHPPPARRTSTTRDQRGARRDALRETSTSSRSSARRAARRRTATARSQLGYIDAHHKRPFRLTLKDQAIADAALRGHARALPPPRHRGARGADPQGRARPDRGRHLPPARPRLRAHRRRGARAWSLDGEADARVLPAPEPRSSRSATIAAAGENMPPKSTYFFPKVPTGLLFNPLALTSS